MNTATVIDVWNQVVLPGIVNDLVHGTPQEREGVLKASLQLAEDIFKVNNTGTRPAWAKAILKD